MAHPFAHRPRGLQGCSHPNLREVEDDKICIGAQLDAAFFLHGRDLGLEGTSRVVGPHAKSVHQTELFPLSHPEFEEARIGRDTAGMGPGLIGQWPCIAGDQTTLAVAPGHGVRGQDNARKVEGFALGGAVFEVFLRIPVEQEDHCGGVFGAQVGEFGIVGDGLAVVEDVGWDEAATEVGEFFGRQEFRPQDGRARFCHECFHVDPRTFRLGCGDHGEGGLHRCERNMANVPMSPCGNGIRDNLLDRRNIPTWICAAPETGVTHDGNVLASSQARKRPDFRVGNAGCVAVSQADPQGALLESRLQERKNFGFL